MKRAGDERKQREQKEQEIIKLKKQCKERQDEETRLRRDLEEHRRYHDFLAQVCLLACIDSLLERGAAVPGTEAARRTSGVVGIITKRGSLYEQVAGRVEGRGSRDVYPPRELVL